MKTLSTKGTTATWKADISHSEVKFKIRHLVISFVTGHFRKFDVTVECSKDDFSDARIKFEADARSVDTNDAHRDEHLRSPDFFDAATYPKITFVSDHLERDKNDSTRYTMTGELTIKDLTKPQVFTVDFHGIAKSFGNAEVASFEVTGKIDRMDYDLKWNALTESGTIVAGEEVHIEVTLELKRE